MSPELLFSDAVLPASVQILRLTLRPYSIGHELLLLRQRNPLLYQRDYFNGLPIASQISALVQAVLVCHRPWATQNDCPSNLRQWSRLLGQPILAFRGRTIIPSWHPETNWPLAIAEFRNYHAAAHETFAAPDPRADEICADTKGYDALSKLQGRSYGAPHLARLLQFVGSNPILFDLGRAGQAGSIFDVPYAFANAIYLTWLESEGRSRIENSDERETKEDWEKIVAETRAEEEKAEAAKATAQPETPSDG